MKRFKNILLVAENGPGAKATTARTVALAKRNRAQLTIVDVVEQIPKQIGRFVTDVSAPELVALIIRKRQEQLEKLIAPARRQRIKAAADVLVGRPFVEIIRAVVRNGHDLVVMSSDCGGRLRGSAFGSMSLKLMRKCPCPVWVMTPTRRKRYARIVAAVGLDGCDNAASSLDRTILELATALTRTEEGELHIVHAWSLWGERMLRGGFVSMPAEMVAEAVRDARSAARTQLDVLLAEYALEGLKHEVHLLKGDAGEVIPAFAERKRVDLIVMGTLCRTGIPGFIIGNTAENILRKVDCSVLTVKPEGFVSPVSPEKE
ncbi:MAG: universal stress protein [Phycisphaerales bacterium JB039]